MRAPEFLNNAADLMVERGKQRDSEEGERSMARCVASFNAMTGHQLTEEEGWKFMVFLKLARMENGGFTQDDYEDCVAYTALMGEAAVRNHNGQADCDGNCEGCGECKPPFPTHCSMPLLPDDFVSKLRKTNPYPPHT